MEKKIILFILNEDINDNIKIIKSLEDSGVLIDGITETVKHEIKKQKVQPVISSVIKGISGRGVRKPGREYKHKKFLFRSIL